MYKKVVLSVTAFVMSVLFGATSASALTVQPTVIDDVSVSPGETIVRSVKLTNEQSFPVKLKATVYDAEPSDSETGFPKIVDRKGESALASWINKGVNTAVSLEPGESKSVDVYFAVPSEAEPGGHYAVITWGLDEVAQQEGVGAGVAGQAGVNLAIDVKGDVVEKGDLISFSTADSNSRYDKLPIEFVLRVNNSGNRHFKPTGTITVSNMFGKAVAVLNVNETASGGNVLPNSTRGYSVKWDGGFAFGKYTAKADVSFGKAGAGTAEYEVWVLPAGLLMVWLVGAVVVVLILVLLVKNLMMSPKKA